MSRIRKVITATLAVFLLANAGPVWAGENEMMDALIHKLVEKGVLTREEAREIRQEVAEEAGKMARSREADVKDTVKKMAGGSWLEKVQWSGDLRLRHESQLREPAADRQRERFRLRMGLKAKPWDPLEIGVRLATGSSGDPVSTNQSFASTFDKKAVFIDQAYAKYTPWSWLALTGGKMENPFVIIPEGVVWDHDVTPEGVVAHWALPGESPVRPFATAGAFQISELSNDTGDPALFGAQVGANVTWPWWGVTWRPSVAYYDVTGVEGKRTADVTNAPAGNSTDGAAAAARFRYDYDLVSLANTIAIPAIWGQAVTLLHDYTHNTGANDDGGAYMVGLEVGKVTGQLGSWKAGYFYKWLEADATFGAITDSDFGAGGTNHFGHIMGLTVGLNKHASAGIKYVRTDEISGSQNKVDTLQADVQMKF